MRNSVVQTTTPVAVTVTVVTTAARGDKTVDAPPPPDDATDGECSPGGRIAATNERNVAGTVMIGGGGGVGGGSGGVGSGDERPFHTSIVADKYMLLEQAEGSSLYRCMDVSTREELVCKIVSKDSHSLVSAHYRLDGHPRISSLHEVLVGNRYLYLVYPKAHGDLHSYVRTRKRLRESEARRLFKQIAETVQICHRNGIVLRDLKLRKFVFGDPQRTELKLESLEDAVVLEEPETDWLHDKRGCPAYVSPEILKAGAHYSGKGADMWSLGVILYTMLVGRYPFNDSEHASLFAKISRGHFVIPDCLSSRARCLIRSLLRKEPSERITSEDILYHPWLAKEDNREWTSKSCDQLVPECSLYDD